MDLTAIKCIEKHAVGVLLLAILMIAVSTLAFARGSGKQTGHGGEQAVKVARTRARAHYSRSIDLTAATAMSDL